MSAVFGSAVCSRNPICSGHGYCTREKVCSCDAGYLVSSERARLLSSHAFLTFVATSGPQLRAHVQGPVRLLRQRPLRRQRSLRYVKSMPVCNISRRLIVSGVVCCAVCDFGWTGAHCTLRGSDHLQTLTAGPPVSTARLVSVFSSVATDHLSAFFAVVGLPGDVIRL